MPRSPTPNPCRRIEPRALAFHTSCTRLKPRTPLPREARSWPDPRTTDLHESVMSGPGPYSTVGPRVASLVRSSTCRSTRFRRITDALGVPTPNRFRTIRLVIRPYPRTYPTTDLSMSRLLLRRCSTADPSPEEAATERRYRIRRPLANALTASMSGSEHIDRHTGEGLGPFPVILDPEHDGFTSTVRQAGRCPGKPTEVLRGSGTLRLEVERFELQVGGRCVVLYTAQCVEPTWM